MINVEQIATLTGGAIAVARLVDRARPFWNYGPPWLQALLPAVPLALTQFAGEVGLVQTRMGLVEATLTTLLTVGVAMRGAK